LGRLRRKPSTRGRRQQPAHARRQPDDDAPGGLVACRLDVLGGARHQLQDADAVVEQALADFGQHHAAAVARQQVHVQVRLEQAHLTRQGRLRDVEDHRRLAETAQFGDAYEVFELLEVHGATAGRIGIPESPDSKPAAPAPHGAGVPCTIRQHFGCRTRDRSKLPASHSSPFTA
jgi:hypothetical protein